MNSKKLTQKQQETLEELKKIEGLEIAINGIFIWVSGNTKANKERLKKLGLWYARRKKMWYLKPENYKSIGQGRFDYLQIMAKYGHEDIK